MRWVLILLLCLLTSAAQAAYAPEFDVRASGADPSGNNDATAAFNKCLVAAGSGGTCYAGGGKFKLLGNVTIPTNTTLACGDNMPDQEDTPAAYGTAPRLMLDSAHTIGVGGQGARIEGCLIVRNGMSFPATDSTAYAGTAITAANPGAGSGANFQLLNDVIIGFDTCLDLVTSRPWIDTVYADCSGATHAAIYLHTGNGDGGYVNRLKIQPLGTGNYHNINSSTPDCVQSSRPGIGLENDGNINYFGDITVQNFRNINIKQTSYMPANILWSDFIPTCTGSSFYPNSIGIENDGILSAREINLNGNGKGLVVNGRTSVYHLFVNAIAGDCVVMPVASVLYVTMFDTNAPGTVCGAGGTGHAINYTSTDVHGAITVLSGIITGIASTPYIKLAVNTPVYAMNISEKLITDLVDPSSIFGPASVSCTGAGSTGTCGFKVTTLTTPYKGIILINAAGTAPASSGTATLNMPEAISIGGAGGAGCVANLSGDSGLWNAGATVNMGGINSGNPITEEFFWSNNGVALTAGKTYAINYHCDPQ